MTTNHKPTEQRTAPKGGGDFYPTPAWCTRALIAYETFEGDIWECACGNGVMADVLKTTGCDVYASDLVYRGYGEVRDFLDSSYWARNIVTNPPYDQAQAFVEEALTKADGKVCMLLRLAFLEGAHRANTIFNDNPPSRIHVFSERITFYPDGVQTAGSGTTAYAWFVWDHAYDGPMILDHIKPGFKHAEAV